ncbi:hypothetical protein BC628DRAFT_1100849 [Trametes gibbosa]|nr:hypothetical protein BC628DRAFT_1100849 [Trametes gibbosa]
MHIVTVSAEDPATCYSIVSPGQAVGWMTCGPSYSTSASRNSCPARGIGRWVGGSRRRRRNSARAQDEPRAPSFSGGFMPNAVMQRSAPPHPPAKSSSISLATPSPARARTRSPTRAHLERFQQTPSRRAWSWLTWAFTHWLTSQQSPRHTDVAAGWSDQYRQPTAASCQHPPASRCPSQFCLRQSSWYCTASAYIRQFLELLGRNGLCEMERKALRHSPFRAGPTSRLLFSRPDMRRPMSDPEARPRHRRPIIDHRVRRIAEAYPFAGQRVAW